MCLMLRKNTGVGIKSGVSALLSNVGLVEKSSNLSELQIHDIFITIEPGNKNATFLKYSDAVPEKW